MLYLGWSRKALCSLLFLFLLSASLLASQPPELSPESLPEIAAKEYHGDQLRIVRTLEQNSAYTRYLITYQSEGLKISGIMNVPKGSGPFPVIITNHGYIPPSIYTVGRGVKREQDFLARRGFVVVHPDYRNHGLSDKDPQSESGLRLGYVEDVINAVLAVQKSRYPFLDKKRIGMLGHSLGGGIALNIMVTKPELVRAFVLYAPVSADYIDNFNRWIRRDRVGVGDKILAKYGEPEANPGFWKNLSASTFFDQISAPIQVHHGVKDDSCYIAWSDKLVQKLKDRGKPVSYFRYPQEKHEFIPDWRLFMERTAEFFQKELPLGKSGMVGAKKGGD